MKSDKKPTQERLRKANPERYAELCELAGCYGEAFKYYSQCEDPDSLIHAAELAIKSSRRDKVEGLCKKALESTRTKVVRAQADANSIRSVGTSIGYINAQEKEEEIRGEVSRILNLL